MRLRVLYSFLVIIVYGLLSSCSAQNRLEKASRDLVKELELVDSKDTFLREKENIQTLYLAWVEALIIYTEERGKKGAEKEKFYFLVRVEEETKRIQNLPGCREWVEWAQRDAVHKLDAYDRKSQKKDPFAYFAPKVSPLRR